MPIWVILIFCNRLINNVDRTMMQSMNQLTHVQGKQTVAEFIQNEKTFNLLKEYGMNYTQGHYLGKPLDFVNTQKIILASQ